MKIKKAFTLAEVLVTLMIIGVIAAITIPTLKKISDERTYVTAAQKSYSALSTAVKNIKRNEGPVKMWVGDYLEMRPLFEKEMNAKTNGDDYGNRNVLELNGQTNDNFYVDMELLDGSVWFFDDGGYSELCNLSLENVYKDACLLVKVDTNGENDPNMVGLDVIGFYVKADGTVLPFGAGTPIKSDTCSKNGTGWGCTARMITEGKISW